jgi:dGTPase
VIDLEDAHRLNILSYNEVEELLLPLCDSQNMPKYLDAIEDEDAKISYMRARAINTLIRECSDIFYLEQESILKGELNHALMDMISEPFRSVLKRIADVSVKKIYNYASVVQIEIAGYKVMNGLLEEFVPAYLENKSKYHKKLVELIPKQFLTTNQDTYSKIQTVLDFVSGMTDIYAVELFRKIKGISFPSIS